MSDLIFALNIVLPIIILIGVGYVLKRIKLISEDAFKYMNKLVFMVLLPTNLFMNIYDSDGFKNFNAELILIISISIIVIFSLGLLAVIFLVKDNKKKGVILQALFRSNYAIIGIPLATSIGGDSAKAVASFVALITIPIFNILATIALSIFVHEEGDKHLVKSTIVKIIKNPLIIGIMLGIVALLIRLLFEKTNVSFRLTDIAFLYSALSMISRTSTPVALITLGGLFNLRKVKDNILTVSIVSFVRLALIPFLVFLVCLTMFDFGAAEYATLIGVFGSPVAVSSAIMAKEMGSDDELANEIVVVTTIFSVVTIFLAIYIFRVMGVF